MKRKKLVLLMILAAILLGALAVMTNLFPEWLSSILAFPLEPISLGLNALAAASRIGNGFSVMLSAALVMIPLLFALRLRGDDKIPEKIALLLVAGMILVALYGARNPGAFQNPHISGSEGYNKMLLMIFSLSFWVMIILFVVLRLIRLFRAGHREQLLRYLRWLAYATCILLAAGSAFKLADSVMKVIKGMPTAEDTGLFILKSVAALASLLLNLAVAFRMLDLLDITATEEQEGLADAASRLSKISCIALACTVAFTALIHIVQLFLITALTDVKANADLPLSDIVFVLVILLLSRLLVENKQLKDDNSMFI